MKKIIFLLLAILCASSTFGQSKQRVAIYVTGDADNGTKKVIGSKLVSAITKDDGYVAVERTADFLAALGKEQNYQASGSVADNQIVALGRQFGVRFVCVADVSSIYGATFVAARMINVETAVVTATAERDKEVNGIEDLTELSEDISAAILNKGAVTKAKPNEDLQELARKTLGIEFAPDDIGPFTKVSSIRCRDGWGLPNEAQMRWLISKGICKESCYWLNERKEEEFGSKIDEIGFTNVRIQGGTYLYNYYICGGSVDKFKDVTYEFIYAPNNGGLIKNDVTEHEYPKGLYVRCVRKID